MRNPVFGSLRPIKSQTGLLSCSAAEARFSLEILDSISTDIIDTI